jgi:plasmid stabilization system protein ParE
MRFRYKLARAAKRNLQEISDYWMAQAGEGVALRVVTGILETIIALSSQPRAGAPAEQFGEDVRKFAAGKYIIYYRLRATKASRDELLQRHAFFLTSGVDCWRFNPACQITASPMIALSRKDDFSTQRFPIRVDRNIASARRHAVRILQRGALRPALTDQHTLIDVHAC